MNMQQLLTLAGLSLLGIHANAGDYDSSQTAEKYNAPDMLEMYIESEQSAARYHREPPEPHWTDTLREEHAAASGQKVGISYGNQYGTAGALRPAADETFGTVAVYFRTTF